MLNAIGDSASGYANFNDEEVEEDQDDDDEDTALGEVREDDDPGWVKGTLSKMVQQRMESIMPKEKRLNKLMQLGWGDMADYFCERDMTYGTAKLNVLQVVKPETDTTGATPSPKTFGLLMQTFHIIPRKSQMPQVASRPRSSPVRRGWDNRKSHNHIASLLPDLVPDLSQIVNAKPAEPVRLYPCIYRP